MVTMMHSAELEHPSSDTISAGSELLNDQGDALCVQLVLGKNSGPGARPVLTGSNPFATWVQE